MLWVNLCGELLQLIFIEVSVNEFPAHINSIFLFNLVIIIEELFHQITFIDKFSCSGSKKDDWVTFMHVWSILAFSIFEKVLVLI